MPDDIGLDLHSRSQILIMKIKTVQAIPIKFAEKIFQLKTCIIFSQSDDLALHLVSNLTTVKPLYYNTH